LKETRPLWPPQRGVGLQKPNLGKTNPRVTLLICLRFVFPPSLGLVYISNANPTCSCVYICEFQFRPIHPPPSRRLSGCMPPAWLPTLSCRRRCWSRRRRAVRRSSVAPQAPPPIEWGCSYLRRWNRSSVCNGTLDAGVFVHCGCRGLNVYVFLAWSRVFSLFLSTKTRLLVV
jgi:hypothetical protein